MSRYDRLPRRSHTGQPNFQLRRQTMWKRLLATAALAACATDGTFSAQAPDKVDFARDVQPIFRQNCYGCHGPRQQNNNLRLDRRRDAMRGGTIAVIGPGNSEASHLYLRLV